MRRVPQVALAVIVLLVLCLTVAWGRRDAFGQPETVEPGVTQEAPWEDREDRERQRQFQWHLREVQLKAAQADDAAKRLEWAAKIAEISQHELSTAAYAIARIRDLSGAEKAAEILQEILKEAKQAPLQRILRIELAQLHADRDQNAEAVEQLRKLIVVE